MGYYWTEERVQEDIKRQMEEAFARVLQTSLKYDVPMRTADFIVGIQ
jgi:glutamate dehydrogenase (NAD(P)+)